MAKYLSLFILLAAVLTTCGKSDQSSSTLSNELPPDLQKSTLPLEVNDPRYPVQLAVGETVTKGPALMVKRTT